MPGIGRGIRGGIHGRGAGVLAAAASTGFSGGMGWFSLQLGRAMETAKRTPTVRK